MAFLVLSLHTLVDVNVVAMEVTCVSVFHEKHCTCIHNVLQDLLQEEGVYVLGREGVLTDDELQGVLKVGTLSSDPLSNHFFIENNHFPKECIIIGHR